MKDFEAMEELYLRLLNRIAELETENKTCTTVIKTNNEELKGLYEFLDAIYNKMINDIFDEILGRA